jgi:hypothetical protein
MAANIMAAKNNEIMKIAYESINENENLKMAKKQSEKKK